jgi:hypothetical protein
MPPVSNSRLNLGANDNCQDELAIFGGQTRVLVSKLLSSKAPNWDAAFKSRSRTSSEALSPSTRSEEDVEDPSQRLDGKMEELHPSLMEYMTLFPPSAFAPDFKMYPNIPTQQPTLDQSIINEVPTLPQFAANAELSNYSYPQYTVSQQQPQSQQQHHSMEMNAASTPNSFPFDASSSSSFDSFPDPQTYSMTTPTSASTPDTSGSGDLADLGMMMNGESGIDEQWKSFMRDSGIFNRHYNNDAAPLAP